MERTDRDRHKTLDRLELLLLWSGRRHVGNATAERSQPRPGTPVKPK